VPAEEHNKQTSNLEGTTRRHSFDDLAKGMANGTVSRGQALRWLGGAIAGAMMASIPGVAFGKGHGGGNRDCTAFCKATFPAGRGNCIADAARGGGACYTCGPAAPTGHPDVCGAGTSNAVCCPSTAPMCVDGQCVAPTGPNLLRCFCQDNTQIDICTSVNCDSGVEQDEVCGPLCASHGGESATACLFDDPSCVSHS
jgi:hypothetical protein